uniref:E3 ubiquitin protein ligase (EC) n=1 Tax=Ganoderma boninense TaxID=34458 RepID=A0A5K1K2E3_9APHY|nr:E3 ubiquitin protein ligase (EC [Ganoderma boninense]
MVKTTTVNVLQHQHNDPSPDCEPSFADVVHLLTTRPPITDLNKTWDLSSRISSYLALFAYSFAHPKQFALWANDAWTFSETIAGPAYAGAPRREGANAATSKVVFAFCVARLFLFAPRGPEVRAREPLRSVPVRGRPVDGIDLKVVINRWGMQNCYIIDAKRTRPNLWRRPVEKLSALAISVLLADGHKVIGVVELPSKPLQIARECRASLVRLRDQAWLHFTVIAPRVLGQVIKRLATATFNITVYGPRFLWFFVGCSPYILFHAVEVVCLVLLAFGTVVVHDLEDLGCIVQDFLAPHASTVLDMVQAWLAAVLEVAFLTDDEIRRCMMQRVDCKVSNEAEEWSRDCDEVDGCQYA